MANLTQLGEKATVDALSAAMNDNAPATVTVKKHNRWPTYASRIVAVSDEFVWLDFPKDKNTNQDCNHDFTVGEEIGITFRRSHFRYVFPAHMNGFEEYTPDDETNTPKTAIRVKCPESLSYTQRRTYKRIDLSSSKLVRASFWLGGWQACPVDPSVIIPVWSGHIHDISQGGCFLRTASEAASYVDVGDIVGLRLIFGEEHDELTLDAQMRHSSPDGSMVLIGFQFVDVDETKESMEAFAKLKTIIEKLSVEVEV